MIKKEKVFKKKLAPSIEGSFSDGPSTSTANTTELQNITGNSSNIVHTRETFYKISFMLQSISEKL